MTDFSGRSRAQFQDTILLVLKYNSIVTDVLLSNGPRDCQYAS